MIKEKLGVFGIINVVLISVVLLVSVFLVPSTIIKDIEIGQSEDLVVFEVQSPAGGLRFTGNGIYYAGSGALIAKGRFSLPSDDKRDRICIVEGSDLYCIEYVTNKHSQFPSFSNFVRIDLNNGKKTIVAPLSVYCGKCKSGELVFIHKSALSMSKIQYGFWHNTIDEQIGSEYVGYYDIHKKTVVKTVPLKYDSEVYRDGAMGDN